MKKITYDNLYKAETDDGELITAPFGLYEHENLDFQASKDLILEHFKAEYEDQLNTLFKSMGLKLHGFEYYSPNAYNYATDSLDTILTLEDVEKYKNAIKEHEEAINHALSSNKSYDGYTALTVDNTEEELNNLKNEDFTPDMLIISTLLLEKGFKISVWDIYDNLKEDDELEE